MAGQNGFNMIQLEHFITTTVNFRGAGLGPSLLLLKTCATGAEASRVFLPGSHTTTNT
jgi:hypothetical protein